MGQLPDNLCFLCSKPAKYKCKHCQLVYFCNDNCRTVHRPSDKCFPFVIKQSKQKGRYMVAVRDIPAMDVILVEKAAACGPKLVNSPVCVECLADVNIDSKYVFCHRCSLPFCSDKCRTSRVLHTKKECAMVAGSEKKIDETDLGDDSGVLASITAARLLNLRSDDPDLFERVDMLMDNIDKIRNTEDFQIQEKCVDFLIKRCKTRDYTEEDIHRALGIFKSNSCNMAGFRGRGLFPTFSLINHSCVRNARHIISSDDRIMEIVAQRDIKKGEEINVRYTSGAFETMSTRYTNINSQWNFTCDCPRCSDNTELGTYTSSIYCQKCKSGLVIPNSSDISIWRCCKCSQEYSKDHVDSIVEKVKLTLDKVPNPSIEKLETFIKVASKILHTNHCLLLETKQKLIQLYGSTVNPAHISRKLELAEEMMMVMDKLDPGVTTWRGKMIYDVTRFKIMMSLQELQSRKTSPEKVVLQLTSSVSQLEMAVSGLTGERFSNKGGLRQRMMALAGEKILGDGYKMLLNTCLKMPFIK